MDETSCKNNKRSTAKHLSNIKHNARRSVSQVPMNGGEHSRETPNKWAEFEHFVRAFGFFVLFCFEASKSSGIKLVGGGGRELVQKQ